MKLSANAREFVSLNVKKEFAKDLKEAEANVKRIEDEQKATFERFEKDLKKVLDACALEVSKLVKKHNLTWRGNKGPDNGAHVSALEDDSRYNDVDANSFNETHCEGIRISAANGAVTEVKDRITRATAKALFEIEVHGKKDTLEEIVAQVIREIREEK